MWLPGADTIRVPPRAWLPATLCLAVLSGFGISALFRAVSSWAPASTGAPGSARRASGLVLAAVSALVLAEGWFIIGAEPAPQVMPSGIVPRGAVVLDLPIEQFWKNATAQYRAVMGGYRSVAGFSGYAPPHFELLRHQVADHHDEALTAYRRLADLYVIVRSDARAELADWIATREGAVHLLTTPEWRLYRLARVAGGAAAMPLPLPLPGSRPFAID
jgi:hypothetical protein